VVDAAAALRRCNVVEASYAAYDFMTALGLLALGHMWLRIATASIAANTPESAGENVNRLARARHFMSCYLPRVAICVERVKADKGDLMAMSVDAF
jgi:hypothetical protein